VLKSVVKAFEKAKLPFRGPHKLRHPFLTAFYAATNESRFLARKVAGHNEERSMAIYSHIGEKIALEQTQKKQSQKKMKII
jgi:integrase